MSLVDPRTVAYWPLLEQEPSVLPSDASGHLPDLGVPAGAGAPVLVQGTPTGFGRQFDRDDATVYMAADAAGALRLTRGVAVVGVAQLDAAAMTNGDVATLIQRGRGGVSDPIVFGVQVEVVTASVRLCRLAMFWETEAGGSVLDPGVEFTWPADAFLLLAAVREVDGEEFTVRYQVNGQSYAAAANLALDCGGVTSADVSVGGGMAGATYQNLWQGAIDALQILTEAASPEELRWLWERTIHAQPEGVGTMRRLTPPSVYSTDPESRIQRELANEGSVLGYTKALAARLRHYLFPDVAWGEVLAHWERLTERPPKPGDSIQRRRDRLTWFLEKVRGYGEADIRNQLAESLDQLPEDIQIVRFTNDHAQGFDTDPGDAIEVDGNGSWAVGDGVLTGDSGGAGTTPKDLRYHGIGVTGAQMYLYPLGHGEDAWVTGKVAVQNTATNGAIAGLVLGRRDTDEWVFIGVRQTAPDTSELVWFRYRNTVLDEAVTVLNANLELSTASLRLHVLSDGTIDVRVGTTAEDAIVDLPLNIAPDIGIPQWAGFALAAPNAVPSAAIEADFDDYFSHTPKGPQKLYWYVYRDLALPGNPDINAARLLIQRIKPAHTDASAGTALVFAMDDPDNGWGQVPFGDPNGSPDN